MDRLFVAGLLFGSLAVAQPVADEKLQPCGDAFYYPSKVRATSINMATDTDPNSIPAITAISSAQY
jgi:hypothetical protein